MFVTKEKNFLFMVVVFVASVMFAGCEGKDSGILSGDTACNQSETWMVRFTSNGDTVRDTKKDLVWEKTGESGVSWQKAKDYCAALTKSGLKWRLPTMTEFKAILGKCPMENDCLLSSEFEMPCGIFWVDKTTKYNDYRR